MIVVTRARVVVNEQSEGGCGEGGCGDGAG